MRTYKSRYYKEQVENPDVATIITMLRDESFRNKMQRRKMMKAFMDLFHLDTTDSRKFFKRLGDAMTQIGEDMLKPDEQEVDNGEV